MAGGLCLVRACGVRVWCCGSAAPCRLQELLQGVTPFCTCGCRQASGVMCGNSGRVELPAVLVSSPLRQPLHNAGSCDGVAQEPACCFITTQVSTRVLAGTGIGVACLTQTWATPQLASCNWRFPSASASAGHLASAGFKSMLE
ncbi:hypothetical protein COO60DRAFT_1516976 [Scenedesmus sp. NREL 46B-D3]|nr:hypothetical protein COO60DRAFT_1516976 [Scenedesmus sp. NREL 46B-D3]